MVKTLNDYIEKLTTDQQNIIVAAVIEQGDRPGFHRGLLPFLPAQEAHNALKITLEKLKASDAAMVDDKGKVMLRVTGERFLRQTMSVFARALSHRLHEDEDYTVMQLDTVKLKKHFKSRFAKKFVFFLHDLVALQKNYTAGELIELQMVAKDKWRVTTRPDLLNEATMYLSIHFRK